MPHQFVQHRLPQRLFLWLPPEKVVAHHCRQISSPPQSSQVGPFTPPPLFITADAGPLIASGNAKNPTKVKIRNTSRRRRICASLRYDPSNRISPKVIPRQALWPNDLKAARAYMSRARGKMSAMGQKLHIDDVRAMSACVPTAEVSVRRGECRKWATMRLMHRSK